MMDEQAVDEDHFPDGPKELGHHGDANYMRAFLFLFTLGIAYLVLVFLELV